MRYLILLFVSFILPTTLAQTSEYQFPKGYTRVQGNALTFCIAEQAPLFEFDEAVAREIARTLGTNAKFYPYDRYRAGGRVMGMQRREFVILLTDHCDMFMGMPRSINATFDYPADEEQLSTRPYMVSSFIFASKNPELTGLRDLKADTAILFEHASLPTMFVSKVRPDLERLHAVATVGSNALFDRFDRGDAEVMIAWGPAFFERYPDPETAGIQVYPVDDLPNMDWLIVGGMSRERAGLRSQVDQAIVRLIENGTIDELIAEFELPETFFEPGPVKFASEEGDDREEEEEELEGIDFEEYGYDVEDEGEGD